ncbi:MAG: CIA30 family protein [Spirochaetia bacterium]|nr:CIA30 family protein [Spirochaetia bacterium]
MKDRTFTLILAAAFLALHPVFLRAGTFVFNPPWNDSTNTITDLSWMNHKPAGVSGRVAVSNGHLYVNSGADRIRFCAVNFTYTSCFPDKGVAEAIAKRLAKCGVNLVRFHLMDANWGATALIDYTTGSSRNLSAANLDRLDYFYSKLRENGIYANFNLVAGRMFMASDDASLPASLDSMEWKDRQTPAIFNPVMIELQKEYATNLLTHVNTYTGMSYASDPALVFVEAMNEHGLLHTWHDGGMDRISAEFNAELQAMWDAYLITKYGGSFSALQAAWGVSQSMGTEKLVNGSFASGVSPWQVQFFSPAAGTAGTVPDGFAAGIASLSITVTAAGTESWHTQVYQLTTITAGAPFSLSFSAKASASTGISVAIQEQNGTWQTFFQRDLSLTTNWQRFEFVFAPSATTISARLNFFAMPDEALNYQIADVSFRQGGTITGLKSGETGLNSIKIFLKADEADRPTAAKLDWCDFLWKTEESYWTQIHNHIKSINPGLITIGTVVGNSTPNLMNIFDMIDSHAYWYHPAFPVAQWQDPWYVTNSSLAGATDGGTISGLAVKRVAGKPFSVTEYNHPQPNSYGQEAMLFLSAYAAFQDWDAIYAYTYQDGNINWSEQKMAGYFDYAKDPSKMANFMAGASIFRLADVAASGQAITVSLSKAQEVSMLPSAPQWRLIDASDLGINKKQALMRAVAMVVEGGFAVPGAVPPASVPTPAANRFVTDTGELDWNAAGKVFTINTDRTKSVLGYCIGQNYDLGGIIIRPLASMQNWASISVTLKQGATLASGAQKMLVTAAGFSMNTGMEYRLYPSNSAAGAPPSADANINVSAWGTAPVLTEGIGADIVIPYPYRNVKVYSLDATGARVLSLPVANESGNAKFSISDARQTIWYEVEVYSLAAPTDTYTMTVTMTQTPGGPTNTPTVTPTYTATVLSFMIDDCEDMNNINNLGGYWYTYRDVSSTVTPYMIYTMASGGANSSAGAARMYGTVAAPSTGNLYPYAGMGSNLNAATGTEADISGYYGVRLYVKGNGQQYYIKIPYTNGSGTSLTGYNDYKFTFTAPAAWTLIEIPFTSMTQEGNWGTTAALADVLVHAKEFQWQTPFNSAAFDIWVDDFQFYNLPLTMTVTPTTTLTQTETLTRTPTLIYTATFTPTVTLTATTTVTATQTTEPTVAPAFFGPNPYNAKLGHQAMSFGNLAQGTVIKIYDLKGGLVFSDTAAGGVYRWNIYGQKMDKRVSSGVYMLYLIDPVTEKAVSHKIAIIR